VEPVKKVWNQLKKCGTSKKSLEPHELNLYRHPEGSPDENI